MIRFYNQVSETFMECNENTKPWLLEVIREEGFVPGDLMYIFMDDEMLLEINKKHLSHDFYTDIITFDLSETEEEIAGEMYVSTDRVNENAMQFGVSYAEEMHRVLVHGLLHLCGYDDKNEEERKKMRAKEDYYLQKIDLDIMLES